MNAIELQTEEELISAEDLRPMKFIPHTDFGQEFPFNCKVVFQLVWSNEFTFLNESFLPGIFDWVCLGVGGG